MNIQPLPENRKNELFDLLRLSLGEKQTIKRNQAFWGWKHEQNPFGASLAYVAEEGNELVGLRTFLRWQWRAGNEAFRAIRAVDTATHPAHQRKGIFSKLTMAVLDKAREDGVDFVYNTPNHNSMPGYLKMGWHKVGTLPMFIKVLSPVGFAMRLTKSVLLRREETIAPGTIIDNLTPAGDWLTAEQDDLEDLLVADRALRGAGLTTARSVDFLQWRYAAHPYVDYHVVEARSGNDLVGALFCRANVRKGLREVMINDILLRRPDRNIIKQLVSSLAQSVRADYLIAHFGADSRHLSLIRQCGFRVLPWQGMDFTVRNLEHKVEPDPFLMGNWSLCLGDLEIF